MEGYRLEVVTFLVCPSKVCRGSPASVVPQLPAPWLGGFLSGVHSHQSSFFKQSESYFFTFFYLKKTHFLATANF